MLGGSTRYLIPAPAQPGSNLLDYEHEATGAGAVWAARNPHKKSGHAQH